MNKKTFIFSLFLISATILPTKVAIAKIPSTEYMQSEISTAVASKADASALNTKVETSATANQTMAGTYTVSGTFNVPTPTLPTAE